MSNINPKIQESWKLMLKDQFKSSYFVQLKEFLIDEKLHYRVFPSGKNIFAAFDLTPFDKVKVVILGQDPYHGAGQAHGLCFSVPDDVAQPPSLQNIFKELQNDLGLPIPKSGNLTQWAEQGVLLLNATLTVRAHMAGSHQNKGWEQFTDAVISKLSKYRDHLVFLFWGNYAIAKENLIDTNRHLVLKSPHPSPLSASRGFFNNHHFSKTNEYLAQHGIEPINWRIE